MARPIMTRDELAQHHVKDHGRNYLLSDDGYGDMEVAERQGWHAIPSWGRDGWDLGNWPYVAIYTRETDGKFEMQQVVEGDHSVYSFDSAEDREAAIDYLFLWYAAGNSQHWAPITTDQREMLDIGYPLVIPAKWRGPYRADRSEGQSTSNEAPHCRNHLEFRSDCEQCVSAREFE